MEEKKQYLPRLGRFRVKLTRACNLSCLWCHKEGELKTRKENMNHGDISKLIEISTEFGVDEIKFTGGEPLLYNKLEDIIKKSKKLGIPNVTITTNGILLPQKAEMLKESGIDEISITLDTMDPKAYKILCGGSEEQLHNVFKGIKKLKDINYNNFNLNTVLSSQSVKEIHYLTDFAEKLGVPLRLITMVDLSKSGLSAEDKVPEVINLLKEKYEKESKKADVYEHLKKGNSKVSIIHTCTDCDLCSKSYALRLTSDGKLKPCLFYEKGEIDILTPLREGDLSKVREGFIKSIALKRLGLIKHFGITPLRSKYRKLISEF